jgi:hypothetical protein
MEHWIGMIFVGMKLRYILRGHSKLVFACLKAVVFVQFKADTEANYEKFGHRYSQNTPPSWTSH